MESTTPILSMLEKCAALVAAVDTTKANGRNLTLAVRTQIYTVVRVTEQEKGS